MANYKDKVAVITGGASGVGYAIGAALAKEGAKVVLSDIESSALESAKANLEKDGLRVDIKQADVSDHDSMVALNKFVTSEIGDVQMLFNNAGVATVLSTIKGTLATFACSEIASKSSTSNFGFPRDSTKKALVFS